MQLSRFYAHSERTKRQRLRLVTILAYLFLLAGCIPVEPIEINQAFSLEFGGVGESNSQDIQLSFDHVVEDSRCPPSVNCIVAGQVTVGLFLNHGGEVQSIQLSLGEDPADAIYRFDGYELELLAVSPYPTTEVPIEDEKYVATMIVSGAIVCPEVYAPVCGNEFKRVVCITEPCEPVELYRTYSNQCEADAVMADVFFDGECNELEGTPVEQSADCLLRYSPFCDCGITRQCRYVM